MINDVITWMLKQLESDRCLYQDDVVDYLVKSKKEHFLKENAEGNLVLNSTLLKKFREVTKDNVVWVRSEFYWRYRVLEDEEGRNTVG